MRLLETNGFLTTVVMDTVVPDASNITAKLGPDLTIALSQPTASGMIQGSSIIGGSIGNDNADQMSQVTFSAEDLFSPDLLADQSLDPTGLPNYVVIPCAIGPY